MLRSIFVKSLLALVATGAVGLTAFAGGSTTAAAKGCCCGENCTCETCGCATGTCQGCGCDGSTCTDCQCGGDCCGKAAA